MAAEDADARHVVVLAEHAVVRGVVVQLGVVSPASRVKNISRHHGVSKVADVAPNPLGRSVVLVLVRMSVDRGDVESAAPLLRKATDAHVVGVGFGGDAPRVVFFAQHVRCPRFLLEEVSVGVSSQSRRWVRLVHICPRTSKQ